jgi:hypothetical protein
VAKGNRHRAWGKQYPSRVKHDVEVKLRPPNFTVPTVGVTVCQICQECDTPPVSARSRRDLDDGGSEEGSPEQGSALKGLKGRTTSERKAGERERRRKSGPREEGRTHAVTVQQQPPPSSRGPSRRRYIGGNLKGGIQSISVSEQVVTVGKKKERLAALLQTLVYIYEFRCPNAMMSISRYSQAVCPTLSAFDSAKYSIVRTVRAPFDVRISPYNNRVLLLYHSSTM